MDLGQKLRSLRFPSWLPGSRSRKDANSTGVEWVGNPDTAAIMLLGSAASPDAAQLLKATALATSAYCYTATEYRWRTISEPPLDVIQKTDEGDQILANHPLAVPLVEPSPDYDMGELQAITEAYRLITGAALWVKTVDPNFPSALRFVPFSGDQFKTEPANGRIYGRFLVDTSAGRKTFEPSDVVHFRETNPNSWRDNLSKLDVALSILDLGHQVNRTVRNFMRKAMAPGGVISPDAAWNPDEDQFREYTNRIKAWHSGPGNAGEPLVTLGGTKFTTTALRFKDLLPTELLDRIEATVASVYGIPPVVLGWQVGLENSPWSQMSEARRMTYEDTIEPRWRDIEKRMTRQLLAPADRAAGRMIRFDTRDVRALQHDYAKRATTAAVMRREWTLDERRAYTGKEPFGDERGETIEGAPTSGGPDDGDGDNVDAGKMEAPAVHKYQEDPRSLAWLLFDVNCKAAESTWEREIFKALERQQKAALRLARKYLRDEKQTDPNSADLFVSNFIGWMEDEGIPDLLQVSYPLILATAKNGVRKVATGLRLSFDIFNDSILGYAEAESAFLADVMGTTTGKDVAAAVQKSLELGELPAAMRTRLQGLKAFDRARAKLTARTETTRAWNGAQRRSLTDYQASTGNQIEKSWLSSRDGVPPTRQEHADLDDGTYIPIDSVFANGLTEPGEPNCRCTLLYRMMTEPAPTGAE